MTSLVSSNREWGVRPATKDALDDSLPGRPLKAAHLEDGDRRVGTVGFAGASRAPC
jgi:hypothetical protein